MGTDLSVGPSSTLVELATSCSYASSTSVFLVCANATCFRCGERSAAAAGCDSRVRLTVEMRPARVRTIERWMQVPGGECAARRLDLRRRLDHSVERQDRCRTRADRSSHGAVIAPLHRRKYSHRRHPVVDAIQRNATMNTIQQVPCNCTTCPGTGCSCGCQQAAAQTAGACGPQCQCGAQCLCGSQCQCGAGASCAQS